MSLLTCYLCGEKLKGLTHVCSGLYCKSCTYHVSECKCLPILNIRGEQVGKVNTEAPMSDYNLVKCYGYTQCTTKEECSATGCKHDSLRTYPMVIKTSSIEKWLESSAHDMDHLVVHFLKGDNLIGLINPRTNAIFITSARPKS